MALRRGGLALPQPRLHDQRDDEPGACPRRPSAASARSPSRPAGGVAGDLPLQVVAASRRASRPPEPQADDVRHDAVQRLRQRRASPCRRTRASPSPGTAARRRRASAAASPARRRTAASAAARRGGRSPARSCCRRRFGTSTSFTLQLAVRARALAGEVERAASCCCSCRCRARAARCGRRPCAATSRGARRRGKSVGGSCRYGERLLHERSSRSAPGTCRRRPASPWYSVSIGLSVFG